MQTDDNVIAPKYYEAFALVLHLRYLTLINASRHN
jgi:hypothetical protein